MIVCSIVFVAHIPSVMRGDGYDLCRMDVLEQRMHRQRHLFTLRFKLFDNDVCKITDDIEPIPFAKYNKEMSLRDVCRCAKDLAETMVSRLNPVAL